MFGNIFIKASLGVVFVATLCCVVGSPGGGSNHATRAWMPCALAAPGQATTTTLPVTRAITKADLEKLAQLTVTTEDNGQEVKYTGVPLRAMFIEMMPGCKLSSMPEWKALNKQELVVEVKGDDGFPGLVTATELAMNKSGDRYILATQRDGKDFESGVQLICKMDEARTRWVRQIVSVRIVSLTK